MAANPVKECLEGAYYYETGSVKSSRSYKSCSFCGKSLPPGSAYKKATIYRDEFIQIQWCEECEKKYVAEISEMEGGEYDSY